MAKGLRAKQIRELLPLPLTTLGDTVSHDGTTSYRIPGNTAAVTKVFAQTGNGTLSALPVWTDLSSIYVPFSGAGSNVDLNNKQLTNVSLLTVNGDSTINGLTVGKGLASITTNTAFGVTVLNANTTGLQNTGVGYTALMANTTGTTNTAVGDRTLLVNNTGINNTAIGGSVLRANTSGTNNTGVGVQALGSVTTGIRNVGLGVLAGFSNTVGNRTIALGNESLHSNVAGSDAIAIGYQAMYYANDTATPFTNTNIAIGFESLKGGATPSANTGSSNNALGYQSLAANTTGGANIAIGYRTLFSNTSGNNNTMIGHGVATLNTVGTSNVALGFNALYNNITGSNAVAIGYNAMLYANNTITPFTNSNTAIGYQAYQGSASASANTGNSNTVIGYQTLLVNTTGNNNATLGYQTLLANTTGSGLVAIGSLALAANTTGTFNTAVGYNSSLVVTTGVGNTTVGYQTLKASNGTTNTAVGYRAMEASTSGDNNTVFGALAMYTGINSGSNNTAIGYTSMQKNTTGATNTALGQGSLRENTTGANNIAIGNAAGFNQTTGNWNIYLGNEASGANGILTGNYNTVIGSQITGLSSSLSNNIILADGQGNIRIQAVSTGYVGMNVAAPDAHLHVKNTTTGNSMVLALESTASVRTGKFYFQMSDSSANLGVSTNSMTIVNVNTTGDIAFAAKPATLMPAQLVVKNIGNIGANVSTPTANFQVGQFTQGAGTVTTTASGITVTGVGTQFTNTFKVGDTITVNAETRTIASISSDTVLTTNAWTGANSALAYTLVGGTRVSFLGNGRTGFGTTRPTAKVEISDTSGLTTPLFRIQGSAGELFSVYDSLTGSLFSVNDISGLPVLEAFSDNTILMGSYLAPSLNTTVKTTAPVGSTVVYAIPYALYTGGFFEYVITDGTNKRAGSIMSVWDGTSIVNTEASTIDIGNTSNLTFTMTIVGANAVLTAVSAVGTWTIKTIVRSI